MKHLSLRLASALGLVLLLNGPAFAGAVYTFVTETRDGFNNGIAKGRVLVEGEKFRIEHEPKDDAMAHSRAVVSKDGGEHRFALNPDNRTFFELEKIQGMATSPLFLLIPAWGSNRTVSNVRVDVLEKPEPETVAGSTVRRCEITLSYDITIEIMPPPGSRLKGPLETVRGKVKADAVYWMAEDKAPLPAGIFAPEIRTSFPEIDGKLAEALATLRGLAVKQQVTVSMEGDSYIPSRSNSVTTTVTGPKPIKTEAALFEVPKGFRMHKPEFSGPGMSSAPMPVPGAEGPP